MASKIFTPITSAAAANGSGNETNVGSSRFVLCQNTSAVSAEVLVTLRTSDDTVVGTFYVSGDSSVIIKKATTDTIFAADANVYFTGVTVTNI
tara:strand:+ start:1042 stop:1320 length:279 start_codon:yes stop_codon:yes gene_type:complete